MPRQQLVQVPQQTVPASSAIPSVLYFPTTKKLQVRVAKVEIPEASPRSQYDASIESEVDTSSLDSMNHPQDFRLREFENILNNSKRSIVNKQKN